MESKDSNCQHDGYISSDDGFSSLVDKIVGSENMATAGGQLEFR